jgi:transcriptional regulator with XRE-family HTH domain
MKTTTLNKPTLSSRIRFARQTAEFKQEDLATTLHITKSQFSRYETGKSIPPSDKTLLIADTCKVDPGWLLSGRGNPF